MEDEDRMAVLSEDQKAEREHMKKLTAAQKKHGRTFRTHERVTRTTPKSPRLLQIEQENARQLAEHQLREAKEQTQIVNIKRRDRK